ncbi:hypothetical protein Ccar_10700 [Clostridium carboxidivorans P7]|uniref:Uncharacterized protein n=1 Tax=Clostridium carboxidivorans P7 TaxID=536227 RepID=C6PNU5_9CLOT|nr:hypothetical protein [Clostridium carboxidivorans]AKN31297.1 hypothetical protein Ccar_10700 [Clostridium carboxidivorans P7]EET89023.1 hypothetical protein CcarbDRAFT_0462 [Clostridium carboxidivorans P7]EFG88425.1 hypothetical protein CLCAR_2001 [Clostridium carboxidivorans P7]
MNNIKYVLRILKNISIVGICIMLLICMYKFQYIDDIYSRDSHFRKYVNDNQQIYFLGTAHEISLDSKPYSYLNLKSVIENLKPDVLLIESRPEQLNNGNFADGPPEMLYCHLVANKLGIPVKGVDWWIPDDKNKPSSTNPVRDNYINENILKSVIGYKKVLILMGMEHVTREQPKLQAAGYKKVFFSEIEKIKLLKVHDNKLTYPKGMNYYIQKRIDYEKSCIGTLYKNDTWKNQAEAVIENLNRIDKAIEQTGES